MKKFLLILILVFCNFIAFADEVKDYYIETEVYYLFFCPEDIEELRINGDGGIDFYVNSTLENSKNFITIIAHKASTLSINIETEEDIKSYKIISSANAAENCDERLVRLDVDFDVPEEKFDNSENEANILPDAGSPEILRGGRR